MPQADKIEEWRDLLRRRYESYLKTTFYFKDTRLRQSFEEALQQEKLKLITRAFPEMGRDFRSGESAHELAKELLSEPEGLFPALINNNLYSHQSDAIRQVYRNESNVVVATGTASGKTESFLYPILFELFRQYQSGKLNQPGVRALLLYPMNALANDQRKRLGKICENLEESEFSFTFGQYIGETPEDERWKNDSQKPYPGEIIFRRDMRRKPPHILLTNYSMLEYLLIRPQDSALFDNEAGKYWQFIVLDEAHQYRGTIGMEIAMLIRRLKQRIRDGGRKEEPFRCIATSATITRDENEESRKKVGDFAGNLFGEEFNPHNIIFAEKQEVNQKVIRFHTFMRALEGAFLLHEEGSDKIVLNRKNSLKENEGKSPEPLEIALCRECGQHYYVGHIDSISKGNLHEAVRDPSDSSFGVIYLLPPTNDEKNIEDAKIYNLCRFCGDLSSDDLSCRHNATIQVYLCKNHPEHRDQIKECAVCGYGRFGNARDPVHEVVHGADGPNTVIATALHEKLCVDNKNKVDNSRILAFADSRQEAAFFAWYAESSFNKIRDRNFILRAMTENTNNERGLSIKDLQTRLLNVCQKYNSFLPSDTYETKERTVLIMIYSEILTDEKRISLQGTGLAEWYFELPPEFTIPKCLYDPPWNFSECEARSLIQEILMELCSRGAVKLMDGPSKPEFKKVHGYMENPQKIFPIDKNQGEGIAFLSPYRESFKYIRKTLRNSENGDDEAIKGMLRCIVDACTESEIWIPANEDSAYHLDLRWLRISPRSPSTPLFECDTCARTYFRNIRNICPRSGCPGKLGKSKENSESNHYLILYQNENFPSALRSEEHTAQLESKEAKKRQEEFIQGKINLLSSSTTFEIGVDLSALEAVFMRNVPPEPFNYIQRAGRAGRDKVPGLAVTYCRRNPHDLYHFENPKERILRGEIRPPVLNLKNEKIILRHITAVALSLFFRKHDGRFKSLDNFIGDWRYPKARKDFYDFCDEKKETLLILLEKIVPSKMHHSLLNESRWLTCIAGEYDANNDSSPLARAEMEVCSDYLTLEKMEEEARKTRGKKSRENVYKIGKRMDTIAEEKVLDFLSRKAIIPKYGFPVDVVELDTHGHSKVTLQRDLSQAIAEYAPRGKVIANKLEWESLGIKTVEGKEPPSFYYHSDEKNRNFTKSTKPYEGNNKKFLVPQFGFVTSFFKEPKIPSRRTPRLFTTRPYFVGFPEDESPLENFTLSQITVSHATPGEMVVLCKGRKGEGFYICQTCYAGFLKPESSHKTPKGKTCKGTLANYSLGHCFLTDVVRLRFDQLTDQWDAYSLAYALLLGSAQTLQLPNNDLNVTITGGEKSDTYAIILYDNVPGGAGLVENLCDEDTLREALKNSRERVSGGCGCDSSCYGCLRSYRNQFAHPHLNRKRALDLLDLAIEVK